jgi:glycosyltransferase involved in cell wall biosynthesis
VRIAVNTRLLLKDRLEGLGRFTAETLKLIVRAHPEHEFYFLFDRPFCHDFIFADNVTPVVIGPPARHPVLWHVWFEMSVSKALKQINPDLFLSPDGFLSLKSEVKSLPVIHDLNFTHNPADLAKSHAWFYNRYFPKYAQKAERIATVSQFSRQDLAEQYGIEYAKIDVVYNGVSDRFSRLLESTKVEVRKNWSDGNSYFIYVGAIHQRKNIERMLDAYDKFRERVEEPHRFILVGNKKWWTSSMQNALEGMNFKEEVIFAGRVSDEQLNDLMGGALANLYVSTFEGFGIPIIEAFQSQIPVITSNVSSMPEIAANAAMVVDPYETEQIADAMLQLYSSQNLRKELVAKGIERASEFTWQRTANLLWSSIIKATE